MNLKTRQSACNNSLLRLSLQTAGGRIAAPVTGEESPGFKETEHQITSGWGNPRESAAENYRRHLDGKVEKAR